jgi:Tol biopolymer transport system component
MRPDGSERRLLVKDGGWPCFGSRSKSQVFFHSRREGKWGVWRVGTDGKGLTRITPADLECFTPAVASSEHVMAVAVKRGAHRQIELMDLDTRHLEPLTDDPTDHWNPSISADARYVVYHKASPGETRNVERWGSPWGDRLTMLRVAGAFPAFSPDGKRVALTGENFSRVDVMNVDGSDRKTLYTGKGRSLFGMSWAHRGDLVAFSLGGVFQGPGGDVDLAVMRPDGSDFRTLEGKGNDGFPSFSPDGEHLVFRSGRDGAKNLYVMAKDGTGVRRLTEGKWTDTMGDWSPAGDGIVFASDRDGDFEIWLVKPDGTGLRKLVAGGGRNNHPHFTPDGKWVVFTSQRAGRSAEEISLPSQPQPYGELFAVRLDGTGLVRLTHNGFEEGTPACSPR